MDEEPTYGIDVPPDEEAAYQAHVLTGGDPLTEQGLADIKSILQIGNTVHAVVMDITHGEKLTPEKYMILRACRAVRAKLTSASALLEQIEKKYTDDKSS